MEQDKINIELKSEVLNEVLSAPPSWLTRSGNTLFFFIIFLLISICYFIKYPDEIVGEVSVQGSNPPVEFQNQVYGKLASLSVKDQDQVKKGQIIAQFDTKVNPKHIVLMRNFIQDLDSLGKYELTVTEELKQLEVSALQQNWNNLLAYVSEFNELTNSDLLNKKIEALKTEISQRKRLQTIADQKLKLIQKELGFQKVQLETAERLFDKKAISKDELLREQKAEVQLFHQFQGQREAIVQGEIQLSNLEKTLTEVSFDTKQQIQKLEAAISSAKSGMQIQLEEWSKNTAWIAPFDGKILFNKQLHLHSFYKPTEASIVIVPQKSKYSGVISISNLGAGKVIKGKKVIIELVDFPKNDFGIIEGKVTSITSIAKDNKYEILVQLPASLKTSYNKELPAKAILKGSAKIITKDKRLLERFFEKIIVAIQR